MEKPLCKKNICEVEGTALDWLVAKCVYPNQEYPEDYFVLVEKGNDDDITPFFSPSTKWEQGGSIIEREDISFRKYHNPKSVAHGKYYAKVCRESGTMIHWSNKSDYTGPTPLVAAMRCYVASKLGDVVEIPEELLNV